MSPANSGSPGACTYEPHRPVAMRYRGEAATRSTARDGAVSRSKRRLVNRFAKERLIGGPRANPPCGLVVLLLEDTPTTPTELRLTVADGSQAHWEAALVCVHRSSTLISHEASHDCALARNDRGTCG